MNSPAGRNNRIVFTFRKIVENETITTTALDYSEERPLVTEQNESGVEAPCTSEFQLGCIFTLVESKRNKRGSFSFSKKEEKLAFVSIIGWPFLFLKKNLDKSVVMDGLGLFSKTLDYYKLPPLERVSQELRSSLRANQDSSQFLSLLGNYDEAFKDFTERVSYEIANLIPDEQVLSDLLDYAGLQGEATELRAHKIPAKLSLDQAQLNLSSIEGLRKRVEMDGSQLFEVRSMLTDTSSEWNRGLLKRESESRAHYSRKIEEIRPEVEASVADLRAQMNHELRQIESRSSPLIAKIEDDLATWEDRERRERIDNEYVSERTKRAANYARRQLKQARRERDDAIESAENHYQRLIRAQLYRIKTLEQTRDSEISSLEALRSKISALHMKLDQKLGKLHDKKLRAAEEIDRLTLLLPKTLAATHNEDSFWFTFPILVAQYEEGDKVRWEVSPPLILRKKERMDSVKRLFGRFPLAVEARTEKFEKVLATRFEESLESDKNLSDLVSEIGSSQNLLHGEGIGEKIEIGLQQLLHEGWLKQKQFDEIKVQLESQIGRRIEPWSQQLPDNIRQTSPAENVTSPVATPPRAILKFALQTKNSFGTSYSPKKWLSILDASDEVIDLNALGRKPTNYSQQGYLNLLIAFYDSKKEDYELEQRIENDSWTGYALSFLRNLKLKGNMEYDPSGSEYSTLKSILEKLLTQEASDEETLPDGSRIMKRKLSFEDSSGTKISLVRETKISSTGKATMIVFRLQP